MNPTQYTAAPRAPARILVVEDESIIARDLAGALTELGYTIAATVATGEEAIRYARERRADLILMDIRLAGAVDGVQAAEAIQKDHDVPVIYLTAHSDEQTLQRAKETDPFGYLVKPFSPPELRCAIELALHKREINARLREREQWLATTLHSIGDGVVTTDVEQKVSYLNPTAEALTGWKNDEAMGQHIGTVLSLVSETTRIPVANPISRALQERGTTALDSSAVLVARSGAEIPIADSAAPIVDKHGGVLGGVMVFQDVTEQRRTQEEIRKLNEARTRYTADLRRSNRDLDQFAYLASHDLKAPLRAIQNLAGWIARDAASVLPEKSARHLDLLLAQARRLERLLEDLLTYSRAGHIVGELDVVDLDAVVDEVAVLLAPRAGFSIRAIDPMPVVRSYRTPIRELLLNLIGNALKHHDRDTGAVTVTCKRVGDRIACTVADDGPGIPREYHGRAFEMFQTLKSKDEVEGSGMGLAFVKKLIESQGGHVEILDTGAERGTSVYFTWPVQDS